MDLLIVYKKNIIYCKNSYEKLVLYSKCILYNLFILKKYRIRILFINILLL